MGWTITRVSYGAAAMSLIAVILCAYLYVAPRGDSYSTPVGQIASVPLRDGSDITLDTASAVHVDLTPEERRIDLLRGEAFFAVAKDPHRPFVVRVGSMRVIAVGTRFAVRRDGDDLRVIVTQGTVQIESAGHALQISGNGSQDIADAGRRGFARLTAGAFARATDRDVVVQEKSISEAEEALSWRVGYLTFHETTLGEAVAEFNRYNTHKITIEDGKVAAIRISGRFRARNYEAFVRLVQEGYGLRSIAQDGEIMLTTK